jgi:hypothetical protein
MRRVQPKTGEQYVTCKQRNLTIQRHEQKSWVIVTRNAIIPFSSSENKVYGLGGERQRSGNETRFSLSHFSFTPQCPTNKHTPPAYLFPVITTRCLYNPVSVRRSYFPHSQCSCTRTAKQTRQRPNIGYVNETRPRPNIAYLNETRQRPITGVHNKNGGDSI